MESFMYRSSFEYGATPCSEAFEALEEACILYGDPWRYVRDEFEDDDEEEYYG